MDKPEETSNTPIQLPDQPAPDARPNDSIVISQATVYYFVIAILFFLAGFAVAWITFSTTTNATLNSVKSDMMSAASSAAQQAVSTVVAGLGAGQGGNAVAAQPTPIPRQNVSPGDGPSWGSSNAKVTIVEFSDFQCPFCEAFYTNTYPQIRKQYGDKVRFVYRQFPLTSLHPYALGAALASECANEQGKFWEYHDMLFSNQSNLGNDALLQYAAKVGVPNTQQFSQCLSSQKYLDKIKADVNAGMGYSVSGTPTFFINGNILVGAQPFEAFQAAIDNELKAAGG